MRKLYLLFLFVTTISLYAISPDEIIKKTDEIRNPIGPFQMRVSVTNTNDDNKSVFDVFIQGPGKTLIKTIEPSRDRGRNMLMLDENMWVYIPNLKRSVRISLSQKLTGQAANGDIARMRWSGDYSVAIEKETKGEWVLFLKALKKGLTYDQMKVVVQKSNFHPIKAEYLSLSGLLLKEAMFSNYKQIAGAIRPTQISITDVSSKDKKSIITIDSMESKQLNDSMFNRNNLK